MVHELEARQQVFEGQAVQNLVDSLRQEAVEAQVHLLLGFELGLDLGPPDQLQDCECDDPGALHPDLRTQVHTV